jgi:hypothetical protein
MWREDGKWMIKMSPQDWYQKHGRLIVNVISNGENNEK